MELSEFKSFFEEKIRNKEYIVSSENVELFYNYMKLLIEWNKKINLTAIVEEKEIIEKHFLDSLTILNFIKDNDKVIDVGTGAGFPGIPIAIASNATITLLDSLNKRINFLEEVKKELNLLNITNIHGRSEEIAQKEEYRENYDVAVSRAVAPMNVLVEYLLPFVKVGGKCICMKGPNVKEELDNSRNAIEKLGGKISDIINIKLDEENMERNLVIIEKIKKTAYKYPRKPGIPKKEPL